MSLVYLPAGARVWFAALLVILIARGLLMVRALSTDRRGLFARRLAPSIRVGCCRNRSCL
jgi:malonyl CoA-acyl carrier protein transacylase